MICSNLACILLAFFGAVVIAQDVPAPGQACVKSTGIVASAAGQVMMACLVLNESESSIWLIDGAGTEIGRIQTESLRPWATLSMFTDAKKHQWLLIDFYADVPTPDRSTYSALLFRLPSQTPLLALESTLPVELDDLDGDDHPELVGFPNLFDLDSGEPVGWPLVYRLDNNVKMVSAYRFPELIQRLDHNISHRLRALKETCTFLKHERSTRTCEFDLDIERLELLSKLAASG